MATRASQQREKVNEELVEFIRDLFTDRPIAFHPMLARALGSTTGAIFLSQLLYWMPRSRSGWVYKTRDEIYDETSLTRREQESARAALRTAGVLKEKRAGVPARLYFTVDWEQLTQLLKGAKPRLPDPDNNPEPDEPDLAEALTTGGGPVPSSWSKTYQLDGLNRADKKGSTRPTISETTTETTTENVVVDALTQFRISTNVANNLARSYPETYILAKLDFVQWLVETRSPLVGKNPAGYLRRAIEEDYAAPPKYKPLAQRQAEAKARGQAEQDARERRRAAEADYARAKVIDQQRLAEQYPPQPIPGTSLTTQEVWERTLDELHSQLTRPNFEMWLKPATLISCDGKRAIIAAPSRYHVEHLSERLNALIQHTVSTVLDAPVQCQYVPLTELLQEEPSTNGRTPQNHAVSHRGTPDLREHSAAGG